MIAVIQCAGRKRGDAGFLRTKDGRPVVFVAHPELAAPSEQCVFARPDDEADFGGTWRDRLLAYNAEPGNNPLGLLPAYQLYANDTYRKVARHFGIEKTYILSAGWGLISASFLTPAYDITFAAQAERHSRRRSGDLFRDLAMIPADTAEPTVCFASKEYVPLLVALTRTLACDRVLFYNSLSPPSAPRFRLVRFVTRRRTNWQYECAEAFIDRRISAPPAAGTEIAFAGIGRTASEVLAPDKPSALENEGRYARAMRPSYRQLMLRGIDALRETLVPRVEAALAAHLGAGWAARFDADWQRPLRRRSGGGIAWDVQALLFTMDRYWGPVFSAGLSRTDRSIVNELRGTRNAFAHERELSFEDTLRSLDSIRRLLIAVGAQREAVEIAELWQSLLAERFGAKESPAATPERARVAERLEATDTPRRGRPAQQGGAPRPGTHADRILETLRRFPGLDDDQLSRATGITPRQSINITCRKLEAAGRLRRSDGPDGKIVNHIRHV